MRLKAHIFCTILLAGLFFVNAAKPASGADRCPAGMAFIPAGEYLVGWDNGEPDERPEKVEFTPSYCIDEYEYPNKPGVVPEANKSYIEAEKICASAGKRMCTEREWERACRGPRGTVFTYGMKYIFGTCNLDTTGEGAGAATATAAMKNCANEYGVHDMTGNLWEWAAGTYSHETPWPIVKGGSFQRGPLFASCYARFTQPPDQADAGMGFRCCAAPMKIKKDDYSNEASCVAPRKRLEARRKIFELFREPDVADFLYAEDKAFGKEKNSEARAVVIRDGNAQMFTYRYIDGKIKTSTAAVSAPTAIEEADRINKTLKDSKETFSPQACWACEGVCIYTKTTGWSGDAAGAKDAIFKFIESIPAPDVK